MAEYPVNSAAETESLEARITLALETAPEVRIPDGFAASVARRAPPLVVPTVTATRYGRNVAIVCAAVLLGMMLIVARRLTTPSLLWTSVEWLLCAQFSLLAFWLVGRKFGPLFHVRSAD